MIEHLSWLKSLGGLFEALVERMTIRVLKRKPKVYVQFEPNTILWCVAKAGDIEYMQITCQIRITHDDQRNALIITDAHPIGTKTEIKAMDEFKIPSNTLGNERVASIVGPMIGEKGKPWTGRVVLVDQFNRQYKTQKATFKWAGPPV
jgi:hypothetical protein